MSSVSLQAEDWSSLAAMLKCNARRFGAEPAILGEGGVRLSHQELHAQVVSVVRALNRSGIGRGDRVAIVMPQGPDLALAFLAVAAGATAVPLNPAYLLKDFEFYLRDSRARALLVLQGDNSPAPAAAQMLRMRVLELISLKEGGGISGFSGLITHPGEAPDFASADEVALILHTSGTTALPKRVPLSQANLCASARNIAATLQLNRSDISLSVMPLFHIHGLACLLAAVGAGGSCACAPLARPDQFFSMLESWETTWLSAVPTMLQALLDHARNLPRRAHALRFIRSSSAALPSTVLEGLERVLNVPVIESYGMTEAAHQMASNPLPPGLRKPGSVGLPAGPQVAILDEGGTVLPRECVGEVCVMGQNLMSGYEGNSEANASAFSAGWFRTGDQGYIDGEGYLFITGRLKEMINRGGEKIAPREIDEALFAHPAVQQAVSFSVPHASLGEDVVAAVVLKSNALCSESELRAFLLDRLPAFKVPSQIVFVEDVPKGPTGKIQRIGLANRLAQFLKLVYEAPISEMEERIAKAIEEVLCLERVGRLDNFFALGGDSLRGTQVIARLQQALGVELPTPVLFRFPTAAELGSHLDQLLVSSEIEALADALAELTPEEQARILDETLSPSNAKLSTSTQPHSSPV